KQIEVGFNDLKNVVAFGYGQIFRDISKEQMVCLLIGCDWEEVNLSLNFGQETDGDGYQKQKKKNKGGKDERITKAKVDQILNSQHMQEKFSMNFQKLQYASLKAWLPSQQHFDEFENQLIGKRMNVKLKIQDPKELRKDKSKQQQQGADGEVADHKGFYELQDEKEIEDEQNERMAALTTANFKVKSDFNNILIKVDYNKSEDQRNSTIKAFSSAALDKIEEMNSSLLNLHDNLWELNIDDRVRFVQMIIAKETRQMRANFQENLRSYEELCKQKVELENQHTAEVLRSKQIIGATITGASINQSLLKEIQPQIIVVEEAAEVLEPQLVAAIGTWTEYMLLIGDHQQLRPPVDTYHLRKDYNFDISMMERLISNKLPFTTLEMQNRQREEFADLLLDIYGDLKTNHERVKDNHPAKCLQKSVFFWHHTEPENKERSVTNPEEAKRAVKLALFLIQQGYSPSKITILASYRGQTALIRRTMKEYEKKYANLIPNVLFTSNVALNRGNKGEPETKSISQTVKIHTVDMYQGDENDFVIVSLVRSNQDKKIGFLAEMNRRCVAQSRARCGVYFIGNCTMFYGHATWKPMLVKLDGMGCIGEAIGIVCKDHSQYVFTLHNF
ncbi:MAG: AAA domain-containing protein, partial [Cyanobacteria bacterium J06649_11]